MSTNNSLSLIKECLPPEKSNMEVLLSDHDRWEALTNRDSLTWGEFVYGVLTTGVYCRPHCASRLPNRENVRFFETSIEAEKAGFRPCKRCKPESTDWRQPRTRAVLEACRMIAEADEPLSLKALAQGVGLSPFHFQRLFKRIVGVTPKQYIMEKRSNRLRAHLRRGSTITEVMYDAGFASSSRFYEKATTTLGMKPSVYKNGAQGVRIRFAIVPCFLGLVLVASTGQGLCAIDFGDTAEALKGSLRRRFPKAEFQNPDPQFAAMIAQVLAFLENPDYSRLGLPLDVQGTAFQRRVWLALQEIPPGDTVSYAGIASRIGKPNAARAVATACAANPVAVAIPCHRVVRGNGQLGGYRWGLERKRVLLKRERVKKPTPKKPLRHNGEI
ncbi:MAG: bifunctional transcriptional regulator/O6-methylguanine-DNA methyltransferase [Deltaproteobacteria bacterium]|nr:bifunctional transcriptional regulator/O6-methylguanine-DNA methyltransferase [Deltaproteobacteria bacterium]